MSLCTAGYWKCTESYRAESFHWQIGCALGLWWLSQLWVNNHIWLPKSERLAKVSNWLVNQTANHPTTQTVNRSINPSI